MVWYDIVDIVLLCWQEGKTVVLIITIHGSSQFHGLAKVSNVISASATKEFLAPGVPATLQLEWWKKYVPMYIILHCFVNVNLFIALFTTLRRCCVSCTGFLFGGEWSSNSPVWCTRHYAVKCLRTSLMISISSPRQPTIPSVFLW